MPPAYGIIDAPKLLNHLTKVKSLAEFIGSGSVVSKSSGQPASDLIENPAVGWVIIQRYLKPGDLIAYYWKGGYRHLALNMGNGLIACHSASRLNRIFHTVMQGAATYSSLRIR